jgi:hypothetical protein
MNNPRAICYSSFVHGFTRFSSLHFEISSRWDCGRTALKSKTMGHDSERSISFLHAVITLDLHYWSHTSPATLRKIKSRWIRICMLLANCYLCAEMRLTVKVRVKTKQDNQSFVVLWTLNFLKKDSSYLQRHLRSILGTVRCAYQWSEYIWIDISLHTSTPGWKRNNPIVWDNSP